MLYKYPPTTWPILTQRQSDAPAIPKMVPLKLSSASFEISVTPSVCNTAPKILVQIKPKSYKIVIWLIFVSKNDKLRITVKAITSINTLMLYLSANLPKIIKIGKDEAVEMKYRIDSF